LCFNLTENHKIKRDTFLKENMKRRTIDTLEAEYTKDHYTGYSFENFQMIISKNIKDTKKKSKTCVS